MSSFGSVARVLICEVAHVGWVQSARRVDGRWQGGASVPESCGYLDYWSNLNSSRRITLVVASESFTLISSYQFTPSHRMWTHGWNLDCSSCPTLFARTMKCTCARRTCRVRSSLFSRSFMGCTRQRNPLKDLSPTLGYGECQHHVWRNRSLPPPGTQERQG